MSVLGRGRVLSVRFTSVELLYDGFIWECFPLFFRQGIGKEEEEEGRFPPPSATLL